MPLDNLMEKKNLNPESHDWEPPQKAPIQDHSEDPIAKAEQLLARAERLSRQKKKLIDQLMGNTEEL